MSWAEYPVFIEKSPMLETNCPGIQVLQNVLDLQERVGSHLLVGVPETCVLMFDRFFKNEKFCQALI